MAWTEKMFSEPHLRYLAKWYGLPKDEDEVGGEVTFAETHDAEDRPGGLRYVMCERYDRMWDKGASLVFADAGGKFWCCNLSVAADGDVVFQNKDQGTVDHMGGPMYTTVEKGGEVLCTQMEKVIRAEDTYHIMGYDA